MYETTLPQEDKIGPLVVAYVLATSIGLILYGKSNDSNVSTHSTRRSDRDLTGIYLVIFVKCVLVML